MAYTRKTTDEFLIQGLYNGTWEDETSEETIKAAREQLKDYRANMPQYAHRIKKIRVRKEV